MKLDIIRAWKDEAYRQSLNDEQLRTLPENPAGELTEIDLQFVSGGFEDCSNSFDSSFDGCFFCRREEMINSQGLYCQNIAFSNNYVKNSPATNVTFTPMCVYFG